MTDRQEPGSVQSRESDSDGDRNRRTAAVNGGLSLLFMLSGAIFVWDTATQEGLWRAVSLLLVLSTGHLAYHFAYHALQALQALRGRPQG